MEEINFEFKHFDTDRTADLIEIYTLCFGVKPDENYFEWKYKNNPAGTGEAYIAVHNNTIAGFYGVIPEDYVVNGKKRTFYQSMDTMTHPDYRRRGLFTRLAKRTYQHIIDRDGEVFIIGFPGLTSHPGFVGKLDWETAQMVKFQFVNKLLFKGKKLFSRKSNTSAAEFSRFDPSFQDYFSDRKLSTKPIQKYNDIEFLNWRYFDGPLSEFKAVKFTDENKKLIGFALFKFEDDKRCFLHFLDAKSQADLEKLVGSFCQYAFNQFDIDYIYTFETTNNILAKGLKKNGFINNPIEKGPFSYRPPIILYSNKKEVDGIPFFDINNFEVQPILRDY